MTTVACDEGKLKMFLEQCTKCPTLKNVVKIGAKVTDEEKAAGDESGVNIIAFAELEVKRRYILYSKVTEKFDWFLEKA